jgi:hypothetical protein
MLTGGDIQGIRCSKFTLGHSLHMVPRSNIRAVVILRGHGHSFLLSKFSFHWLHSVLPRL